MTALQAPAPSPDGVGGPTDDEIFGIINIVTDLQEADALDKAYPEVFDRLEAFARRISSQPTASTDTDDGRPAVEGEG